MGNGPARSLVGEDEAALWCAEEQSWPGVCGVSRAREVDGSTVARWLRALGSVERKNRRGTASAFSF
uniref:Uncharacterized protein n=1 Tax=Populus trichocarpa TaxID=3694 RepID=U7DZS8_POPTR